MRRHAHVDFRAIPSKLDLIHAGGHKINFPTDVLFHVLRYRHFARIKSVSPHPESGSTESYRIRRCIERRLS